MATRVAGEQYYKLTGQLFEIARQLRQKEGYPFDPEKLSMALQECIEGRFGTELDLIQGLFTPIPAQIARIRKLNAERGWGFTDEDFTVVERSAPEWPDGKLIAVTLVPYLPETNGMGGVERTFHEFWQVAVSFQQTGHRWDEDCNCPYRQRLHEGFEHPAKDKPVLRWEVIDLGHYRNRTPVEIMYTDIIPSAGVLIAAALHPEWVKAMDGDKIPYVWMPGYEVSFSDGDKWPNTLVLHYDQNDRSIKLSCFSKNSLGYSVPTIIRK
jgi:hypothetical protein